MIRKLIPMKFLLIAVFCIALPQGAFALSGSGSRIPVDPTPTPTPPCVPVDDDSGDVIDEETCQKCEEECAEDLESCEEYAEPCTCYGKDGGKSNCKGIIEYLCKQDSYKCHNKCWGEE